jgi:catechol 2,3-dioxygenase-like lactoylglutathione lyase family enzyme
MTRPVVALVGAVLFASLTAAAQTRSTASARMPTLAAPNATGVAMGHYHFVVRDVAANAAFWTTLGGVASTAGATTIVKLTDVIIVLTQGRPSGVSEGSVLNHVAFRVPSLAALESKGITIERAGPDLPGIGNARTPEGERVELFDSAATNVGFTPAAGFTDPVADRHNKPIAVPIASHHFHLYLPDEAAVAAAAAWYAKTFGGTPGKRWRYDAVDLPGINVNLGVAPRPVQPTRGRTLDHIGFEVTNLAAFTKKLEATGVKLDEAYHRNPDGVGEARLTDPWGTSIELTEGLRRW